MGVARKIIGVIFFLSSALGFLGFPSDAPTWYRCLRFGGKACPESLVNMDASKVWNIILLLVGFTLLVPDWWRQVWRRGTTEPQVWPLITLKEIGTNMVLNRPIHDKVQDHLGRLWQDFHSWESQVIAALSRLGASETQISHFKTLKTFPNRRLPAWNEAHAELLNMTAEKLDRLDQIAQQLERG